MYQLLRTQAGSSGNAYAQGGSDSPGKFKIGNLAGGGIDGALRFPNVTLNQGTVVQSARLYIYSQFNGSGTIRFKVQGIKETNTASFSSNPFGRSKTTAIYTDSKTVGSGGYFNTDCTDEMNEILAQGGWSSGNAMGFFVFNNGSDAGIDSEDWSLSCLLQIYISSTPNLTPTPIVIPAPTFPSTNDYGMRVSQPGIDVRTATEQQLFWTSRKKELRVNEERQVTDVSSFAHGLGYAPSVLGYYTDSSNRRRIMNVPSNIFSTEPYIGSDATNVILFPIPTKPAYIYTFIDPLT